MNVKRKLSGFLAAFFLAVSMIMPVQAAAVQGQTGSEAVNNARNGVLQVNLNYIDSNLESHVIQGGTGFLIGDESGAEYMITNYHVVNMDKDVKKAASERFNVDFNDTKKINMQVQVVVKRDVVINATIVNQSSDMDFAILRLEQVIYDRTPLPIDDNDNDLVETMDVYALGFPTAIELVEDAPFYVSSDVNIINGIVSTKTSIDGIKYIRHGATMTEGNSGGPLVNNEGAVVGVNTMGVDDTYFYSLQISEVSAVLKALGITYTSVQIDSSSTSSNENSQKGSEDPVPPEPEPLDTKKLSSLVNECRAMDLSAYDKATVSALDKAIADGQSVLINAAATQEDVDKAAEAVADARDALEKKKGIPLPLVIGLAAAIVVVIIVIVVLLTRKKKITPEPDYPRVLHNGSDISPKPGVGSTGGGRPSYSDLKRDSQGGSITDVDSGSDETSLLNSGSEETSLLGGGETSILAGQVPDISATLVRKKNGEQIQIKKQLFKIGKERAKVDYRISDNNTISRVHVQITYRNSEYYLMDMKSTNFTSVNGNQLSSGQEVKLHNGDKIQLSDEEFEFRC